MSPEKLAQVLRVELRLMKITNTEEQTTDEPVVVDSGDKPAAPLRRWSDIAEGETPPPVPMLSLLHATEFDPRQSKYRDGKWVAPEGK